MSLRKLLFAACLLNITCGFTSPEDDHTVVSSAETTAPADDEVVRCDNAAFIVWESEEALLALEEDIDDNGTAVHLYRQMRHFYDWYLGFHAQLTLVVCAFGIGANILTVLVFTQPGMLSPINCLLVGIAFCDGFVMSTYLVYTLHFHLLTTEECDPSRHSFAWTIFTWFHANSALVLHGSSLWIACSLALTRVLMLRSKTVAFSFSLRQSALRMIAIFILTFLAFIPNFMALKVQKIDNYAKICNISYEVDGYVLVNDRSTPSACMIVRLAFWLNGLLFKFFPAILLSILVCLLVKVMRDRNRRRRALRLLCEDQPTWTAATRRRVSSIFFYAVSSSFRRQRTSTAIGGSSRVDNTSRMLLTLLAIMLTTEIPQGVLTLLNGMSSEGFRVHFYENIADLLDFLSLLNCAINFPLYCVMSQKFRGHCVRLLKAPVKRAMATCCERSTKNSEQLELEL